MGARKSNKKTQDSGPRAIVVFWLIFAVVIISVFLFNYDTIKENFGKFKTGITKPHGAEEELTEEEIAELVNEETSRPEIVIVEPLQRPVAETTQPQQQTTQPQTQTTTPATQPTTQTPQTQTTQPKPPAPPPVQTRDRSVYFAQVNSDGQILQSKVTRKIPVSETPMQDVLNAMLAGPSTAELNGNILNLIPQNTRLLSATVRGSTAYLNFSEDFMFNTFGVEGYVAQLRQIVWTVTEFPNVRDVQILIEGRRLDFLGEGIWIGSPIGRNSF